jgi:hypothetical protein
MNDYNGQGTKKKGCVLKFTKLGYYLCDQAYDAVTNILVFGIETLEEMFEQATGKTRRNSLIVIIHSFVQSCLSLRS